MGWGGESFISSVAIVGGYQKSASVHLRAVCIIVGKFYIIDKNCKHM